MALRADQRNITVTVSVDTHDELAHRAALAGVSISRMMQRWLAEATDLGIIRYDKRQSIRAVKDELMVSLPRDWIRRTGSAKGDRVSVSYSDDTLIVRK